MTYTNFKYQIKIIQQMESSKFRSWETMIVPSTLITIKLSRSFSSSSSIQNLLKRGFTPSLKSINQLLRLLVLTQRYGLVPYLVSQMNLNRIEGNFRTHAIFTSALLELNKLEEVAHFLKTHTGKASNFSKSHIWDSLIQGFCTDKNDPERALQLLQDCLRNYNICPSSFTFCSLIHSFILRGKMSGAIEALELLNDSKVKYPYSNFVCSSIISTFCKMGKPELAMCFFENAVSSGGLVPNLVTYTTVVTSFCMLGRVDEVCNLVSRMEKEGLAFDVVFYSSWICGYLRGGVVMEAFQKHREMVERGIDADTISYTVLVDGFSKEGNAEKALGFLHKMIENGLRPSLVTYTAIMLGFCTKGKIDEALVVFRMLEKLGIEMDEFTYAVLINGLCLRGDLEHAYQLMEDMEKKGINPSIITYNTLINGLCKAGRTSDADELSKEICGDNITYSVLLQGYTEEENILGILEVKRRAEDAGVQMDIVMCNIIIKALFMVGAFEEVHALYKGMQEMNLFADSVTYCTIINGYCKVGQIDEALEIFDEFRHKLGSSIACYNCMINGLCENGMVDMATKVFAELNEKGLIFDEGICMTLIKAILKEGSAQGVLDVIYSIENLGFDLRGTTICNNAISLLCKRKNHMAACEVYMVAKRNKIALTRKSYYLIIKELIEDGKFSIGQPFLNSFIKEYGLVEPKVNRIVLYYLCLKDVNNALYFLSKMKEKEAAVIFPVSALRALAKDGRVLDAYKLVMTATDSLPFMDVVDFSILIDGLCKGRHPVEALDLCCFAEKQGIILNIITYNSVINGLCNQGCFVEAFRLFDSLERINLIPSEITFSMLIDNLCKEGYFLDAKQLFERMVLKGYKASIRIYNSFLIGYCKFGQIEKALKILKNIEVDCLDLDEFSISSMIYGYCQKGDMEEALSFYFEYKHKGISPDFLGFLSLMRGLSAKGRMEEARSILREMLQSQSVMELIKRVNNEVETESIENFLVFLCEQGSIKEAITVLNEVACIYFPVPKWSGPSETQELQKLRDLETGSAFAPRTVSSPYRTDTELAYGDLMKVDKMLERSEDLGRSEFKGFDSFYSLIASFCSRGDLGKANQLAKEMLVGKEIVN